MPLASSVEIEAAARAIRDRVANRAGKSQRAWESLPERLKADYREEATAALNAAAAVRHE
jgi:hypothetical protein